MPRKPDTPCAGGCGTLLWSGSSSLPEGKRMCRACRASRTKSPRQRRPAPPRPTCAEPGCPKRPQGNERCFNHRPGYAEYMRAHYREQTHRRRRRTATQHTDITAEYERNLRAKTRRCPLCDVRMVDSPYLPASKELDHIIPLNVGGTHTVGNVRIICRSCNSRRPTDGSDFAGQPTLWSQDPTFATQLGPNPKPKAPPWSLRLTPACACGRAKRLADPRCAACRGHEAAQLRATGMRWQDIAERLGYASPGAAHNAARYGQPTPVSLIMRNTATPSEAVEILAVTPEHPRDGRKEVRDG